MSRIDLVIFGATGLAGKQVVIYMVNLAKKYDLGTWAVAGRSRAKLDALIAEVSKITAHEEADTKIVFHVCKLDFDAHVTIRCSDTDIAIIMLGNMNAVQKDLKITMHIGTGNSQTFINITKLYEKLGANLCSALPGFHAITGCDFNPALYRKGDDLSNVGLIVADVGDEKSLQDMCAQARLVLNCCGPYRLYGEPVVKAAVENKTNYIDIAGEPQFMESMQIQYDEKAREAGVFVISACGWDSIPADMGVTFLKQNFRGTLNSVESYLSFYLPPECDKEAKEHGVIGTGTWESIIYGMASQHELKGLARAMEKAYPEPLPQTKPVVKQKTLHKKDDVWYLPFPGADESVVARTQRYLYFNERQRPIQFQAYFKTGTLGTSVGTIYNGVKLLTLANCGCTQKYLLNNPKYWSGGYVTKEGPTEGVMKNTHFTFELVGTGWEDGANVNKTPPNKTVVAKVTGKNPAYGSTVVAVIMSAHCLLKERHNMPANGGVMTPGSAFKNTTLIQKLTDNDLKYEIISK